MKQLLAGFVVAFVIAAAGTAQAQPAPPYEAGDSGAGARGAIGCGLLGVEITLTIEAAAGVTNPWLLSLIPLAVGGGAAAGGYFMELASPEAGIATLIVGATFLVPSILLTLVLIDDEPELSDPPNAPPAPMTAAGLPRLAARSIEPSLIKLSDAGWTLGLPSVRVEEAPEDTLYRAAARNPGFAYRLALFGWQF
jgi:hypothetical protein